MTPLLQEEDSHQRLLVGLVSGLWDPEVAANHGLQEGRKALVVLLTLILFFILSTQNCVQPLYTLCVQ